MSLRVAINGFGRIGRNALKAGWGRKGVEFVAVNDLMPPSTLAHLLTYDTVFRMWDHTVTGDDKKMTLTIDGKTITVVQEREPAKLPWKALKIDVVIESSGRFTSHELASAHLGAGATRVVISAPAKEVPTYLMGVNHTTCPGSARIVNNASCTTNSVGPVTQVIHEKFTVRKATLTTIHSVTAEQNLVDGPPPPLHPDLRRARSALMNLVPTSTGAARASTEAIPDLAGKFDGVAVRVPTLDVSLSDLVFLVKKKTTVAEVNDTFVRAAKERRWKGILGVSDVPLVSSDFIGSSFSAVVDLPMTRVVDHDLVKIMAWYDNEWGYSVRLVDMVEYVGSL